ncbi:MAG: hypothetical protein ACO1NX_03960 [Chitinophagaceae bacterium]
MSFDFRIERDYEIKPTYWQYWDNERIVRTEPIEILASYKIYLNNDVTRCFHFEIRKDDNEKDNLVFDHDDSLVEFLFNQKIGLKEVNEFVQRIFNEMEIDYTGKIVSQ